jgi:hypothetical protein
VDTIETIKISTCVYLVTRTKLCIWYRDFVINDLYKISLSFADVYMSRWFYYFNSGPSLCMHLCTERLSALIKVK